MDTEIPSASDPVLSAIERLDRRLDLMDQVGRRLARLEDEALRLRETVVLRSDLAALGSRIEALSSRIDGLAMQVAASSPRLRSLETAIAGIDATTARAAEVEVLERGLAELSLRVDSHERGQTARTAKLSNQLTGWLVSLLLLIVGAMVSYGLLAAGK